MAGNRLNVGDIGRIGKATDPILTYDAEDALADPESLVVRVKTPLGERFELEYGVTPGEPGGDAVIRYGVGTYAVHIRITEARGAGVYGATIVTGGNEAAEPLTFTVSELPA